jgi:predicted ABC-type ATPase
LKPVAVMIAGPNGSGKSTLTRGLLAAGVDLGVHVNPDDIAATLSGSYDDRVSDAQRIADRMRQECIRDRRSFSFETVMSHPSKIAVMHEARDAGFATRLYFVATEDPVVNVNRVAQRVSLGGPSVPKGKIVARYARTLALLPEAIRTVEAAVLFDNTSHRSSVAPSAIRLVARFLDPSDRGVAELHPPTPDWVSRTVAALSDARA